MGRTQQSQGLAPPAIRKDQRAKQARQIINRTIPAILASNARARKGAEGSELIADPGPTSSTLVRNLKEKGTQDGDDEAKYIKRKGQGRRKAKGDFVHDEGDTTSPVKGKRNPPFLHEPLTHLPPTPPPRRIRILHTTTLTAAHLLTSRPQQKPTPSRNDPNICILNMASPLRPGGGVLTGATSQEETLCTHTTLLPSLHESSYRLPEYGGVFTRDVLVFRDARGRELEVKERYFVDVLSAGMLRFPDLVGGEEEEKRLSGKDRSMVERKMRAVLRMAATRGVGKIVLGAWGCGAYGNPVRDVAGAWRRVLDDKVEPYASITDVVFAIANRKMAHDFARAFDPGLEVEEGPGENGEEGDGDEMDEVAEELRTKITEMEGQVQQVWRNEGLKERIAVVLEGLRAQLREREGGGDDVEEDVDGSGGEVETDDASEDEDENASVEEESSDGGWENVASPDPENHEV
ncbi:hypothetical protein CC80DRAFT_491368 [Byssothecium circinans]|uniref:Microbial-type PARG catalytic domain-containing protein n=1 Tax=Byssothecium circinans TaxID=147558 RepID=A0A6A5U079_9PLEO|nr:hypothetical protein CC80DRAFT_491368 [Byssothecium circinans]